MNSDVYGASAMSAKITRKYFVKTAKAWRSQEVAQLLHQLDRLGATKGTVPRLFIKNPRISDRLPVRGLPRNFYDTAWFESLTHEEQVCLAAKPAKPLPVVPVM